MWLSFAEISQILRCNYTYGLFFKYSQDTCNNLNTTCKCLHRTLYLTLSCTFSIEFAERNNPPNSLGKVFTLFYDFSFMIAVTFGAAK